MTMRRSMCSGRKVARFHCSPDELSRHWPSRTEVRPRQDGGHGAGLLAVLSSQDLGRALEDQCLVSPSSPRP